MTDPKTTIEEKLIQEIPSKLWEVSKLRHALFTPVEFSELCRQVIREYFSKNPLFGNQQTTGSERSHNMSCPFPEGCTCGASDWNALRAENERLREELEQLKAQEWEKHCMLLRDDFNYAVTDRDRYRKAFERAQHLLKGTEGYNDPYIKSLFPTPPTEEKE